MGIAEIKAAVADLPPEQQDEIASWLDALRRERDVVPIPYARIAHLAGVHEGAPPDLARNKRYLEGLGEHSAP